MNNKLKLQQKNIVMRVKPFTEKIRRKKLEFVQIRIQFRTQIRIHYPGSGSADQDPHQNEADPKHWFLRLNELLAFKD